MKNGNVATAKDIYELKVAIWAMGHVGLSSDGAGFLSCEGVLTSLTQLAASCPVYSVRGTCFHALCLVATTRDGASLLRKYGKDTYSNDLEYEICSEKIYKILGLVYIHIVVPH